MESKWLRVEEGLAIQNGYNEDTVANLIDL